MNHYALTIREYWTRVVPPERWPSPSEAETFFAMLGETMLTRVDQLTSQLMGSRPDGETALQRIGRETAARKQAEEIAWSELGLQEPTPSMEELREEWAASEPPVSSLADWAARAQEPETQDQEPSADTVAAEWMLPEAFLQEMLASENPYLFVETDQAKWVLSAAQELRFRMSQLEDDQA